MVRSAKRIEETFALIEAAAIAGARCPQGYPYGPLDNDAMQWLYRSGRIRGEIMAHNFRRVTILTGPHAGKRTADPPKAGRVWRTIDQDGQHFVARTGPRS